MERFQSDSAVIERSVIDTDGGTLDHGMQDLGDSRAIIWRSRKVLVAADGIKLQCSALAQIASLGDVDMLFTDPPVAHDLAQGSKSWGTRIVMCGLLQTVP